MKEYNLNGNDNNLKKAYEDKQQFNAAYFNMIIRLINEEAFLQYQVLKQSENKPETEAFEKNINHALTLLAAANKSLRKEGPTPYTDYLISSALSVTAKFLPSESVSKIVDKLNEFNSNSQASIKQARPRSNDSAADVTKASEATKQTKQSSEATKEAKKTSDATKQTKQSSEDAKETKKTPDATKQTKQSSEDAKETKKTPDATKQTNDNTASKPANQTTQRSDNATSAKPSTEQQQGTKKQAETPATTTRQQDDVNKNYSDLIACVKPTLLTSEISHAAPQSNQRQQTVIDFAADKRVFIAYGKKVANKLGGNLIQVQPDNFSARDNFTISKNMTLTLIGHCCKGLKYLSDNTGRRIYASQIAEEICAKMLQTHTSLDTEFTIDLIACQAASANGTHPSFAERLVNELSKRGINNVSVIASPTIMMTTSDGTQANLSRKQDKILLDKLEGKQHGITGFFNNISSNFSLRHGESKINVEKVTFRRPTK